MSATENSLSPEIVAQITERLEEMMAGYRGSRFEVTLRIDPANEVDKFSAQTAFYLIKEGTE